MNLADLIPITGEIQAQPLNDNFSALNSGLEAAENSGFLGVPQLIEGAAFSDYDSMITPGVYTSVYSGAKLNEPITASGGRRITFWVSNYGNDESIIQKIYYDDFGGNSGRSFTRRFNAGTTGKEWDETAYVKHVWTKQSSGPLYKGTGSPEGSVSAPVGSIYQRTDGGAGSTFYVKESGTGNTGWVAK